MNKIKKKTIVRGLPLTIVFLRDKAFETDPSLV